MKFIDDKSLERTIRLTGPVDPDMLKAVDFYAAENMGIFIPLLEHCGHRATPDHAHPAWNFFVHFNRKQVLENFTTEWSAEGFTVTAVPPLCVHTDRAHELNTRYASIYVAAGFFAAEDALYEPERPLPDKLFCFSVGVETLNSIKEFIAEYEAVLPGYDRLLDGISLKICHTLIRSMRGLASGHTGVTERIEINKACDFIHQFYYKKLKVQTLADVAAVSESHFARIFKKETGWSPLDYVNLIRVDKAKKLLAANDRTITAIAQQTGFSSSSHFAATFSKFTGMTPVEFQGKAGS